MRKRQISAISVIMLLSALVLAISIFVGKSIDTTVTDINESQQEYVALEKELKAEGKENSQIGKELLASKKEEQAQASVFFFFQSMPLILMGIAFGFLAIAMIIKLLSVK